MRLTLPIALLVCGCCNKEAPAKADRPPPVAVKTTEPLTPPEPVKLPAPKTLADAVERARPLMADSVNKPDPGAAALAGVWQEKSYTWAELSAVSETKIALVAKDSDAERGKHLCTAGTSASWIPPARGAARATRSCRRWRPVPAGSRGDPAPSANGSHAPANERLDNPG